MLHCSEDYEGSYSYPGGVFVSSLGPAHLSCIIYTAAVACPFLQRPTSRTRDGAHRGAAAIAGFSRHGVAYLDEPVFSGKKWAFGYLGKTKTWDFVAAKELASAYRDALTADAKAINVANRLYWTDSPTDRRRLAELNQIDLAQIEAGRAGAYTKVGSYEYRLALL